VRIEVGPRDIAKNELFTGRRDQGPKDKKSIPRAEFLQQLPGMLADIQKTLFDRAKKFREENTKEITSLDDFKKFFEKDDAGGFALVPWCEAAIGHALLPELKVTPRCIPLKQSAPKGNCIFSGKPATHQVIFAKAY
jgi:prolyl-tRNA synthetase